MDLGTSKEIQTLKNEIKEKEYALEAEKYSFERKLKNGMGENMIKYLNNPPKPNFIKGIILKYRRWKIKKDGR